MSKPNEIAFWNDGWTPDGIIHVPKDYVRLEPGDAFKTRRAKQLVAERGIPLFVKMRKTRQFNRVEAYMIPPDILAAVEEDEKDSKELRTEKRKSARISRAKRHERAIAEIAKRMMAKYPQMPADTAERIVAHSFEVGSDRVGRTTALELDERIDLAVWAHVRHAYTEYPDLLRDGWSQEDARNEVSATIAGITAKWESQMNEDGPESQCAPVVYPAPFLEGRTDAE